MSKQESPEDDLIASLYDAALEPEKWGAALGNLARAVGASGAHVILWNEATQSTPFYADFGVDKEGIKLYSEYWGAFDPRRKWLMDNPSGQWVGCHRICGDKEVEASPFYQEYCIPWDVRHAVLSRLGGSPDLSAMMAIMRPPGTTAFESHHERLLERHNHHLQNAIRVQLRLSQAAARVRVLEELAHHLPDAMLILKADGRLHFMNAAAEALMASASRPLAVRGGRLSALTMDATRRLHQIVKDAAESGVGGALHLQCGGSGSAILANVQTASAWNVLVCPLSARLRLMHGATEPLALVMLSDEAAPKQAAPAVLQALFGFTPAETRVALALMAGDTPDDYAAAQHVKIATVRSQIVALKDMTGTRRHTDLVALLLRVPLEFQLDAGAASAAVAGIKASE